MKDGDLVLVVAEDRRGVICGDAEVTIGRVVYVYRIVRFADGSEGSYQEDELQVIDDV